MENQIETEMALANIHKLIANVEKVIKGKRLEKVFEIVISPEIYDILRIRTEETDEG